MYPVTNNQKNRTWKETIMAIVTPFVKCGKDFCMYTTIHGFNHIAMPGRHWFERLLWACMTLAAICGAISISIGQLSRYNNPTVVSLEKDFRSWLFNMPGVTFCNVNRVNPKKIENAIRKHFSVDPHDDSYEYYKKFVATVANSNLMDLEGFKEFADNKELEDVDLFQLAVDVMPDVQAKATWSNGVNVKWLPVMTEYGACYVTNSIALADSAVVKLNENDTRMFPLTCKYALLRCAVLIEIEAETYFWLHSPYDIVDATVPYTRIYSSYDRIVELSVMETVGGNGIREMSKERRGCLYTDEPERNGAKVFSTNSCRLSLRSKLAIKLCGCRPFYYFYEDGPSCGPAGMYCLAAYAHTLAFNGGEKYSCSPQCMDAVYREVSYVEQTWSIGQFSERGSIKYAVLPPRTRYTREIVFYFQDLVVSFGGAAGLFLGASFISFVEIIYFFLERFLKIFVNEDSKKENIDVKNKQRSVSYETTRIMELNNVLESQKGYEDDFL